MYLPSETTCADPKSAGCRAGYAGGGITIRRHFEGDELDLATMERTGTFVRIDGAPARAIRRPHAITLVFEEESLGVPAGEQATTRDPRLWFEVTCDADDACRRAWLALQTVHFW